MPMFSKPMIFQKNQLVWKRSFTLSNVASTTSEFQKNQLVWKFRSFSLLYSSSFSAFQKNQLVWKPEMPLFYLRSPHTIISEKLVSMEDFLISSFYFSCFIYFRKTSQYGRISPPFTKSIPLSVFQKNQLVWKLSSVFFGHGTHEHNFRKTSQYGRHQLF